MMQMQYNAAQNSQEGVAVKLIDELRDQHLKEAALIMTVMSTQLEKQQQMLSTEIDDACEAFLVELFNIKVCIAWQYYH